MDERARSLARAPERVPDAAEVFEVVTFRLAGERYAIEARHVRRVVRLEDPTPVPGTPEFLAGVINQRGEVLAVFDLRTLLGVGAGADAPERVLVLGDDRDEFGVVADTVQETVTLRIDEVLEPSGAAGGRQYLHGVTSDALIVLDGAALLRDEQLVIDQGDDPVA
jgi:purine-binding chemotaxis protein CheW